MRTYIRYITTTCARCAVCGSLFKRLLFILPGLLICSGAFANTLQGISYSRLPGNAVQVTLQFAEPATEPMIFTIEDPARIALDLSDTTNGLPDKSDSIGVGVINSYSSAEAQGRTRLVLNLSRMVTYETAVSGNAVVVTLGGSKSEIVDTVTSPVVGELSASGGNDIKGIDFKRGEKDNALIQVTLPSAKTIVDMRQEGDKLVVDFIGAGLPQELQRKLDVRDFATPVYEVSTFRDGDNTRMEIDLDVQNEYLAYQSNEDFIIEVKPLHVSKEEAAKRSGAVYFGEKLSLNFQDIQVRAVLQLLADFTGLNVVVSDTVGGSLTLRLKNVPWDQALDIIMKTKGLAKRQTGNVILIAPAAEIANTERIELEAAQQVRELEPLNTEFIPINYANAADIQGIIQSGDNATLLSGRGSVTIDPRTNTLLVRETASQLVEIRKLITELDVPVRQVLIESRIVSANNDFSKSLGVRFGYSRANVINSEGGEETFTPGEDGSHPNSYIFSGTQPGILTPAAGVTGITRNDTESLIVDLPSTLSGASLGLAIGRIGSHFLQLELSAMQAEGRGEVISNPRLVTADKNAATIKSGVQIPYQEASSSGATSTSFQDAVLSMEVTPQITPDDRIIMDLTVNKDAISGVDVGGGPPAISTQQIVTQVVVDNGETVVLGGIYERTTTESVRRVPFFSDLPYIGWAFRNKLGVDNKSELLIFVTPKILKEKSQLN